MLALVAQGKTDRGIADQLFVTRKTVEAHVRSILRKLDLPADASENRRVHAVLAFLRYSGTRDRSADASFSQAGRGSPQSVPAAGRRVCANDEFRADPPSHEAEQVVHD